MHRKSVGFLEIRIVHTCVYAPSWPSMAIILVVKTSRSKWQSEGRLQCANPVVRVSSNSQPYGVVYMVVHTNHPSSYIPREARAANQHYADYY